MENKDKCVIPGYVTVVDGSYYAKMRDRMTADLYSIMRVTYDSLHTHTDIVQADAKSVYERTRAPNQSGESGDLATPADVFELYPGDLLSAAARMTPVYKECFRRSLGIRTRRDHTNPVTEIRLSSYLVESNLVDRIRDQPTLECAGFVEGQYTLNPETIERGYGYRWGVVGLVDPEAGGDMYAIDPNIAVPSANEEFELASSAIKREAHDVLCAIHRVIRPVIECVENRSDFANNKVRLYAAYDVYSRLIHGVPADEQLYQVAEKPS